MEQTCANLQDFIKVFIKMFYFGTFTSESLKQQLCFIGKLVGLGKESQQTSVEPPRSFADVNITYMEPTEKEIQDAIDLRDNIEEAPVLQVA